MHELELSLYIFYERGNSGFKGLSDFAKIAQLILVDQELKSQDVLHALIHNNTAFLFNKIYFLSQSC